MWKLKFLVCAIKYSLSLHMYENMGQGKIVPVYAMKAYSGSTGVCPLKINPLALEMDILIVAHHLYKMWIFYETQQIRLWNTRHSAEE